MRAFCPPKNTPDKDLVMTPEYLAKDIINHYNPQGLILDPARGEGAFYDNIDALYPHTKDWLSAERSPDNFFHMTNLAEYLEFKTFTDKVRQCVNELARAYGSDEDHECAEAWYNIYNGDKYQEFHHHPNNIFSAVYFAKVPDGAQGIYFKRPDNGSMLPPKNKKRTTIFNQDILIAPPEERTVIIFRSNLQHSVPPHNLTSDRVTVALNYK